MNRTTYLIMIFEEMVILSLRMTKLPWQLKRKFIILRDKLIREIQKSNYEGTFFFSLQLKNPAKSLLLRYQDTYYPEEYDLPIQWRPEDLITLENEGYIYYLFGIISLEKKKDRLKVSFHIDPNSCQDLVKGFGWQEEEAKQMRIKMMQKPFFLFKATS